CVKSCPRNASGKRILHFSNRFGNRKFVGADRVTLRNSVSAMSSEQSCSRQEFHCFLHCHTRQSTIMVSSHRPVFSSHSAALNKSRGLGRQEYRVDRSTSRRPK